MKQFGLIGNGYSYLQGTGYSYLQGFGDAASDLTNYDIITIGGVQYSANQIVGKSLKASSDVPLYLASNFKTPFATIKAGQNIGTVFSYIRPDQATAQAAGGVGLLMFYTGSQYFYVKNEAAISQQSLKDQGTQTVTQQQKQMQDDQEKSNDPIMYYLKKVGLPLALGVGALYLIATFGKEALHDKLSKSAA